ncbi:DNA translocase FtsK [Bacillus sp. AFS041924]|uniref:DNA translocase FtsK n=1 Tax=Bacillus sp. AFS041924 TaxID=2033503 RepID=UPI000BFB59F7|nr:DNA translocase FtsK [Bacillus sp. AFS041924]PGS47145.1 cell division protein FtsK [Bacillus sp. AFS041924]
MAKQKQQKSKARKSSNGHGSIWYEITGLIFIALSIVTILKLGIVGKAFVLFLRFFFGEWYMLSFLFIIGLSAYSIIYRKRPPFVSSVTIGGLLIFLSILMFSHVTLFDLIAKNNQFKDQSVIKRTLDLFLEEAKGKIGVVDLGGGMIGALLFAVLYFLFDRTGAILFGIIAIVAGVLFITGKPLGGYIYQYLMPKVRNTISDSWNDFTNFWKRGREQKTTTSRRAEAKQKRKAKKDSYEDPEEEVAISNNLNYQVNNSYEDEFTKPKKEIQIEYSPTYQPPKEPELIIAKDSNQIQAHFAEEEDHSIELPVAEVGVDDDKVDYVLPSLDLLAYPKGAKKRENESKLKENADKLERTFQSFGVKATVTKVHHGPAVTKYEVYPEAGVKVSRIVNLSDDLALALAAKDIRIEAPIPGKSAVGIEVPNTNITTVLLREVLEAKNPKLQNPLAVSLGKDIAGDAVFAELNKMPHLLVAGATGSGKSVCINGIIVSILMNAKPSEVKLMLIDPKMVELNVYNGIPHLLTPVVTNPKKASQALRKVVSEMERRYELFSHSGTRNIEGYNDLTKQNNAMTDSKQPLLPFIVVIVDELADLMMVASSDVEDSITRLAQMARAAGIHLIIATQRPSVDVITGVIKANIPSRIAFSVSSQTDSRTILDTGGAEKLLGRGDMLYQPIGASKPLRVQGAFLSDDEVERVVEFSISQQKAQYQEEMMVKEEKDGKSEVDDDLYNEAVDLVTNMQSASVSLLQRRFRIGYTRAARLIDAMEENGIVGPYEGSKPREVLISKPVEDEQALS